MNCAATTIASAHQREAFPLALLDAAGVDSGKVVLTDDMI